MRKQGINPCTIPGLNSDTHLTLARLWIGDDTKMEKKMTAALWKGVQHNDGPHEMLAITVLDEDVFLSGLSHLFPDYSIERIK